MEGDGSLSIPSPESLPHNTHKKKYPLEWTHLIALCNCWSHLFFNERIRDAIIARRLEIGISNRSSLINARTATPPRIEQLSNNKIKWEKSFSKTSFSSTAVLSFFFCRLWHAESRLAPSFRTPAKNVCFFNLSYRLSSSFLLFLLLIVPELQAGRSYIYFCFIFGRGRRARVLSIIHATSRRQSNRSPS